MSYPRLFFAEALLVLTVAGAAAAAGAVGAHGRSLQTLAYASGLLPGKGEGIKCGLPLIAYAQQHRHDPAPGVLEAFNLLDERPVLQSSTLSTHFRIHYDTTGANVPALLNETHDKALAGTFREYVDSVVASAEYVYHVEVDSLGYDPPPDDGANGGGPEFDIYILNLSGAGYPGTYGFTAPDSNFMTDGGRSSSFIVVDNTFLFLQNVTNRGIRALHVTLGHEYHHAIQMGSYGFWSSEVYFHEITSVWMEAVCYPEVDDYLQYIQSSSGQFANPGVPFNTSSLIMYSRGIWGHYIAKRFGPPAMRRAWEEIRQSRPLPAIDKALHASYGSSLSAAFAEWALWNYFTGSRADSVMYYPAGSRYRLVADQSFAYIGAPRPVPGSSAGLAPLASSYFQITGGSEPLELVTANVDVQAAESGSTTPQDFLYQIGPASYDASYRGTAAGIFVSLQTTPLSNFWSWDVVNGIVGSPGFDEATPFPNPYIADGSARVFVPSAALDGTLTIYSSSMTLVYQADLHSDLRLGRRVFSWNGSTHDGRPAETGVYVYVLSLSGRTVTGKIALIRKR